MSTPGNNLLAQYYAQNQGLPFGYEAVEYLESTGEQFTDTNVLPALVINASITVSFSIKAIGYILGSTDRATNRRLFLGYNTNNLKIFGYMSSGSWNARYVATLPDVELYTIYSFNASIQNGIFMLSDGMNSAQNQVGEPPETTLGLFAANTYSGPASFSSVRLHKAMLFGENGALRNFIPCVRKSDGKPGLYDLCKSICPLTGTPFYINAGTGEFVRP